MEVYYTDDKSGDSIPTDTLLTISSDIFKIKLQFTMEYYGANFKKDFLFFNSAYANKCEYPGHKGCKETITKINIKCFSDFDSIHHAGDTINSLFRITTIGSYRDSGDTHLETINGLIIWTDLYLWLEANPQKDSLQDFTVELYLSNGQTFAAKTKKIIIK